MAYMSGGSVKCEADARLYRNLWRRQFITRMGATELRGEGSGMQ